MSTLRLSRTAHGEIDRYDLILDTNITRSPFEYARALNLNGTCATVGVAKDVLVA